MKLLGESAVRKLVNKLHDLFLKKDEILVEAPFTKEISKKDIESGLEVNMNIYYTIIDPIDSIYISDIKPFELYKGKETYSYIQFATGENPKLPNITNKISAEINTDYKLEPNTNYRMEIKCINDIYLMKIVKYNTNLNE